MATEQTTKVPLPLYDLLTNGRGAIGSWRDRFASLVIPQSVIPAWIVLFGAVIALNYFGPDSAYTKPQRPYFLIASALVLGVNIAVLAMPAMFATWRTVAAGAMGLFLAIVWMMYVMYSHFVSGAYDFAIFSQAIWLIGQGKTPFSTIMGIPYMGDEMHYIFYPIGWIYRFIVQDIRILMYWECAALAAAAFPIYGIARHYQVDRATAVLIALAYLLSANYSGIRASATFIPTNSSFQP